MNLRPPPSATRSAAEPKLRASRWAGPALAVLILVLPHLPGCASDPGSSFDSKVEGTGVARSIVGDWNDVDAAMNAALDDGEIAIIGAGFSMSGPTELSPWCRVYRVRSITDAEGTVVVALDWRVEPDDRGSRPISVRADLDGPGKHDSEQRFLKAFGRRLAQLAGVDSAPLE